MTQDDHERLAARLAELAGSKSLSVLDANALAALAAGNLDEQTRAAVLARLARSGDRELAAAIAAASPGDVTPARTGRRVRIWPWFTLGAVACVALALFGPWTAEGPVTERDLARVFIALQSEDAKVFGGIEPLLTPELERDPPGVTRGGLGLHYPRRAVLEARPAFTWSAPARGRLSYRVTLINDEEVVLFTIETQATRLTWPSVRPPLGPGLAYVWKVECEVAGQAVTGSASFRSLDADERVRHERGLRLIDEHAATALRPLVKTHFLIRLGLLREAYRVIEKDTAAATRRLRAPVRIWLERGLGRTE
ncbi:MAG: hypothetical protein OER88_02425 [Planctomycetota bacterium]|nr:hypothetical protein [Planctomycetota bacterium]